MTVNHITLARTICDFNLLIFYCSKKQKDWAQVVTTLLKPSP